SGIPAEGASEVLCGVRDQARHQVRGDRVHGVRPRPEAQGEANQESRVGQGQEEGRMNLEYGKFHQLSETVGIVICDEWTLPPIALLEPLAPEGWGLLAEDAPLDVNVGQDGWLEVWFYERQV